ncbi:MAG: MlaD family protein [Alphaproteobacteria bacterium]
MERRGLHIALGAVVLALLAGLIVASYRGGPSAAAQGYALTARYNTVDGVKPGTPVLLAGIKIGQVSGHAYESASHRAVLTFTIADGVALPTDSVAKIVSEGLLGSKYIKVDAGGSPDMMRPGDEFEYVQDAVDMQEVLEKIVLNAEARRAEARAAAEHAAVPPPPPAEAPAQPGSFGSFLNP